MKKKILITGFPHTGTTILKSKFGECANVHEIIEEGDFIRENHIADSGDKEFIMTKSPVLPINIRANSVNLIRDEKSIYKDYIIVFVTRNPYYAFTSIVKSGLNPLMPYEPFSPHEVVSISAYLASLQKMKECKENNIPDVYTIRYEDFFDNDYKAIKDIMDSIGLKYDSNIFDNRTKNYKLTPGVSLENIDENNLSMAKDKMSYRTWQINQPFENMNKNVDIPDELSDILKNSNIIGEFGYSDPRLTD